MNPPGLFSRGGPELTATSRAPAPAARLSLDGGGCFKRCGCVGHSDRWKGEETRSATVN